MKYKITHTTSYAYSSPSSVCHNVLMMTPRDGGRVATQNHRIVIRPTPMVLSRRRDYFGNHVHAFSVEEQHKKLSITATSRVTVADSAVPDSDTPAWETVRDALRAATDPGWFDAAPFAFDSPRIARSSALADYASAAFTPGVQIVAALRAFTAQIHRDFKYDSTATVVDTPLEKSFQLRRGVCQDFAHVGVACLRSIGLPARYVSGYLRTLPPPGKPRLVGADQSHAWLAVYCGPELGWIETDPTNNSFTSTDHIPIAWGRDYGDVVPLRGVFVGGGDHVLSVSVDVSPVESGDQGV